MRFSSFGSGSILQTCRSREGRGERPRSLPRGPRPHTPVPRTPRCPAAPYSVQAAFQHLDAGPVSLGSDDSSLGRGRGGTGSGSGQHPAAPAEHPCGTSPGMGPPRQGCSIAAGQQQPEGLLPARGLAGLAGQGEPSSPQRGCTCGSTNIVFRQCSMTAPRWQWRDGERRAGIRGEGLGREKGCVGSRRERLAWEKGTVWSRGERLGREKGRKNALGAEEQGCAGRRAVSGAGEQGCCARCRALAATESQNHRITEPQNVPGWKGPLWVIQSNPPAKAGSPTAGSTGTCPGGP